MISSPQPSNADWKRRRSLFSFDALSDMELLTERDFGLDPDSEDSFCLDGLFTTD